MAAGCVVVVCGPVSLAPAMASQAPVGRGAGWVAYSAYGLQLSVPRSWAVASFQNCPLRDSGTLLIGTPATVSYCVDRPTGADVVWMQPQSALTRFSGHAVHLVIGGLGVMSYLPGGGELAPPPG